MALVGESGSGKSTVCYAVIRLLARNLSITDGRILFRGNDLAHVPDRTMAHLRGAEIGIVFQDPLAALDPVRTIGWQLGEARVVHGLDRPNAARAWAERTLAFARIPTSGWTPSGPIRASSAVECDNESA